MNMQRTVLVSALSLGMVFAAHATTPQNPARNPAQNNPAPVVHAPPPGAPAPVPVSPGAAPGPNGAPNIAGPGSPFANLNLSADQQRKIQEILSDTRTQLMKIQQDTKTRVDSVLTAEQRTKLEADMQAQRQRMMQMRAQQAQPGSPQPPMPPAPVKGAGK